MGGGIDPEILFNMMGAQGGFGGSRFGDARGGGFPGGARGFPGGGFPGGAQFSFGGSGARQQGQGYPGSFNFS